MRFAVAILCFIPAIASAKDFVKFARSGESTRMGTYRSWNRECQSKLGIVKVLSKPSHGTLMPSEVTSTIGVSRANPERTAHCVGAPTNGFRVDYRSAPGFRGTDQFQIQFTYGQHVDIDNYTVNVQ